MIFRHWIKGDFKSPPHLVLFVSTLSQHENNIQQGNAWALRFSHYVSGFISKTFHKYNQLSMNFDSL